MVLKNNLQRVFKLKFSTFVIPAFIFFVGCTNINRDNTNENKILNDSGVINNFHYYEPNVSTLTGIIEEAMFYGPPGYGEDTVNDVKENVYLLKLDKSIDMVADTSNEFNVAKSNIMQLQLLSKNGMENMKNKRVTLSGTLFGAQTGHHHTEVLFELADETKKLSIGLFKGFPPEIIGTYCYYAADKKGYDNDTWVFLDGNDNSGYMKINNILTSFKLFKTDSLGPDKMIQYYDSDNYNLSISIDKKEQKGGVWMRTGEIIVKQKNGPSVKTNFYGGCGS
jgi:hypothetical protein